VLDIHDETTRIALTGRSQRYTRVEVTLFAGRSMEAKPALYKAMVANLAALGVPEAEVKTVLIEVPRKNWGLCGGHPASEIDLGFRIDV
jgi:hypothetical protein